MITRVQRSYTHEVKTWQLITESLSKLTWFFTMGLFRFLYRAKWK